MLTRADFPPDFSFGAATSAYQIEGSSFGGAGPCHWDQFAAVAGNVHRGHNGAVACDHYHRFESDLDYLRGFDAYQFSTSWARVLPEGRGAPNAAGLDFYDRLVDAILARGLKPFLTLYHWELPAALADKGGWCNRDTALWFGDFVELIMARIGDRIAATATINEPWCVSYLSHLSGEHAPGLRDLGACARATHHILLAHGEAITRLRASGQSELGIVLNFDAVTPLNETPENIETADTYAAILNQWFVQAVCDGSYPAQALSGLGDHLPDNWHDDMACIAQPLDWLGVNYYRQQTIARQPGASWPAVQVTSGVRAKTGMDWEIYPDGLFQLLTWLKKSYIGDLPVYITENGAAFDDELIDGTINDAKRLDYIHQHLRAAHRALQAGVNIRGFFFWSLLDNFEWAHGFDKRFGLIHVDFASQKRTPKSSFVALQQSFARGY